MITQTLATCTHTCVQVTLFRDTAINVRPFAKWLIAGRLLTFTVSCRNKTIEYRLGHASGM